MARPLLEYEAQIWSLHYRKEQDRLERTQRRAKNLIPGLRNKPYEGRLKVASLQKRRPRVAIMQAFNKKKGIGNIDI